MSYLTNFQVFIFSNRSQWLMKDSVREIPLELCRASYECCLEAAKIPNTLMQTQMCASGVKNSKTTDACQVK